MKCLNCDTEFEAKTTRSKYCSDKCKVQYNRNNTVTKEGSVTQRNVTERAEKQTPTDRLFDEAYPSYYNFGDKVYTRKCLICNKDFKTRLQLLKTCSPKCYTEVIDRLSGRYAE